MTPLFNLNSIDSAIADLNTSLGTAHRSGEVDQQHAATERIRFLNALKDFAMVVDHDYSIHHLGKANRCEPNLGRVEGVVDGFLLPDARPVEAYLIQNPSPAHQAEPALFLRYLGPTGQMATITGMRYATNEIYISTAKGTASVFGPTACLHSLIKPRVHRHAQGRFPFYAAPIFLGNEAMSSTQLATRVKSFIGPVLKADGFLPDDPSAYAHAIFKLADPEWVNYF